MTAVQIGGAVLGAVLVVVTVISAGNVLVMPRGERSGFSRTIDRIVTAVVRVIAKRITDYRLLDRVLATSAIIRLGVIVVAWLGAMWIGFSLILWPIVGSIASAFREAGSSMLTLGFASTTEGGATAVDFLAAVSGFGLITIFIAYLPSLYSSFTRREALVTLLDSRGGSPPWGPEILARHQLVSIVDDLGPLYAAWEAWAAEVAESHATYPILVQFRSPHPNRSWLLGLLSVMDAAALHLALNPSAAPSSARLCIRMGFVCLRTICDSLRIPYDPDPTPESPLELTRSDFDEAVAHLEAAGFPMETSSDAAWPHFRGWRVNYEATAYALADLISAPHAPWSGGRSLVDGEPTYPSRPADRRPDEE